MSDPIYAAYMAGDYEELQAQITAAQLSVSQAAREYGVDAAFLNNLRAEHGISFYRRPRDPSADPKVKKNRDRQVPPPPAVGPTPLTPAPTPAAAAGAFTLSPMILLALAAGAVFLLKR